MEWLFGTSKNSVKVPVDLSASTARGRSAPSSEDDSLHKNKGNEHFRNREYTLAIAEYSLGIDQYPTATLYSNRSVRSDNAAYCAINQFEKALKDADAAIELDPTWAKTYTRKGKALYGMQLYKRSADAYARGVELSLKGAIGEAQQRDVELEALKKQTESQSAAYMKLLEQNEQLKRQIEDYEHMFGEWSKKQM